MGRIRSTVVVALLLASAAAAAAHAEVEPRITGGAKADPAGWRFAVALEYRSRLVCSGSLIAPDQVLTAAHCVKFGKHKRLSVLAGSPSLRRRHRGDRIRLAGVTVDPKYNGHKDRRDFAVLHLASPAPDSAVPVQLPTPAESDEATRPGSFVHSAGFGTRSAWGVSVAPHLKATRERVYRARKCDRVYGKLRGFNGETQICALGGRIRRWRTALRFRSTTCEGDSGGPIVASTPAGSRLVGVVSGGVFPCGLAGGSIYARVSSRLGFIERAAGLAPSPESASLASRP